MYRPGGCGLGLPVHLHIAEPDVYESAADITAWEQAMTDAGAAVQLFRYPGPGHLFTDPGTPDRNDEAATLAWRRSLSFLASL